VSSNTVCHSTPKTGLLDVAVDRRSKPTPNRVRILVLFCSVLSSSFVTLEASAERSDTTAHVTCLFSSWKSSRALTVPAARNDASKR